MDIEERVARLEELEKEGRQNRLLRLAVFISVSLAALTGCLIMMSKITFDVIKAKSIYAETIRVKKGSGTIKIFHSSGGLGLIKY